MVEKKAISKRIYRIRNLNCANCAAKIESALNSLPEIEKATLIFTSQKLVIEALEHDGLLKKIQQTALKIEDGVVFEEYTEFNRNQSNKQNFLWHNFWHDKDLHAIILGLMIFLCAEFLSLPDAYNLSLLVLAYLILGWRVVLVALKNIFRGCIFDENFLMALATLGAFAINAWEEAVGVMLFYRIGEYFEERAVAKSRSQIMDAVDLRPEVVTVVHGEKVEIIPADAAEVDDVVLVRVGDRIPLDGVIVAGSSLLDTAPITGEHVPVKREIGEKVISGCINLSGMLQIRVEKVLAESMVTRILDSVENAAASKPSIDRFITRFARIYTPIVVILSLVTAIVPPLFGGEWQYWIYTALTFLVISCPCALVLSVPLAFFSGIGVASKYGILFKGGIVLEALKKIKAVVMDKTGTITKGEFSVQNIESFGALNQEELLQLTASAEQASTHPIASSIVAKAKEMHLSLQKPEGFREIAGEGLVVELQKQKVLCGNVKLLQRYHITLTNYMPSAHGSEVLVAVDGTYVGRLIISDTLKADTVTAIAALKQENLVTVLLTGDNKHEAEYIAAQANIGQVQAQLLPQDKLNSMQNLRQQYGAVMFIGDGINDAPVLAGADVGAAMGSGSEAALEASDVVFMNSEMQSVPMAIKIARMTASIAWQNVIFAIAVKVLIMLAGFAGYASMWTAVFADTGVSLLCILNSVRLLYKKF